MSAPIPAPVPLASRPRSTTICLFDVDGTLTPARQSISPAMLQTLQHLRTQCAIGFVGGSNLPKIQEQLQLPGAEPYNCVDLFDYGFAENGLTAYKMGKELASQSFLGWLGEEKYQKLVKFCLRYISGLEIPVMRGTFIEFRAGMINVSPIGRNASIQERIEFEKYDLQHNIRRDFIAALQREFPDYGLTYSIGGQISFDVFPVGWDKTYALNHIKDDGFQTIHFFGDKTYKGGNDYEIFEDQRTKGHTVTSPEDTIQQLGELFQA